MPMKKKSTKKRQKKQTKATEFQKVFTRLQQLFPLSTLSLPHLAKAINQKALVFMTSDPLIVDRASALEKEFNIFVVDNYMEAQDILLHKRRRSSLEMLETEKEPSNG